MHLNFAFLISPGSELLNIGYFRIKWYGFLISLSIIIGLSLSRKLAKSRKIDPENINNVLPSLIFSALVGARSYYVIFESHKYSGDNFFTQINILGNIVKFPSFLAIWEGGIAIHGALIGGVLSIIIFCRSKKIPLKSFLDIIVPSVILGQAIGRWGNFFNNEAFGLPTNLPWKLFIPLQNRPILFTNYEFFHPTFLYESILNFTIFIFLLYVFRRQSKGISFNSGIISCLYIIFYSFGRFWIEGLRTDSLCLGAYPPYCEGGIRIAQFVSIFLFSSGLIWLYFLKFKIKKIS